MARVDHPRVRRVPPSTDSPAVPADVRAQMRAAAALADDLAAVGRRVAFESTGPGERLRARLLGPGGLDAELALRDVGDPRALVDAGVLSPSGPAAS